MHPYASIMKINPTRLAFFMLFSLFISSGLYAEDLTELPKRPLVSTSGTKSELMGNLVIDITVSGTEETEESIQLQISKDNNDFFIQTFIVNEDVVHQLNFGGRITLMGDGCYRLNYALTQMIPITVRNNLQHREVKYSANIDVELGTTILLLKTSNRTFTLGLSEPPVALPVNSTK